MPPVEDVLSRLSDHPPAPPAPVTTIRHRARRRSRLRRGAVSVAAVVLLAGAGALVVGAGSEEPAGRVATQPGGTDSSAPSEPVAPSTAELPQEVTGEGEGMSIAPTTDLDEGSVVGITLDPPRGEEEVALAQCSSEMLAFLGTGDVSAPLQWCTDVTYVEPGEPLEWVVTRTIDTAAGRVDCAGGRRCLLTARVGGIGATDDRYAPLLLRDDLVPLTEPGVVVEGTEGPLDDGQHVTVTITGATPGETARISQCREPEAAGPLCFDPARSRAAVIGPDGSVTVETAVFHDVLAMGGPDGPGGWRRCEPCVLQVAQDLQQTPLARVPIEIAPTDDPIRPRVEVEPAGPHAPGDTVTLTGSGFQAGPGAQVRLGWCRADADPELEPSCTYPGLGPPEISAEGTIVVEGFRLPGVDDTVHGAHCAAEPGACGIGWVPGEGVPYALLAPLDLTG